MRRILLTGGGTAGHVTPNVALLSRLRNLEFDIVYTGTRSGIEDQLITREGIPFYPISAGKLRRYLDIKNFTDLGRIAAGFFQSVLLLIKLRPDIVFSKGGFVSCPVVWAAWLLRIPAVIHESDITPGLANRLSAPFARKICYSFPETSAHLSPKKAVHTGLPIRDTLRTGDSTAGRRLCGFSSEKPVVLIMGGSLGSVAINKIVREALPDLTPEFDICHICGKGNRAGEHEGYRQFEYVNDDLSHLFAMADVFIGRSGATTLFELLALKKPSLLIPLGSAASRGDQILNAKSFERKGFSSVIRQDDLTVASLIAGIRKVYADRAAMILSMEKSAIPDGVESVIRVLLETLETDRRKGRVSPKIDTSALHHR